QRAKRGARRPGAETLATSTISVAATSPSSSSFHVTSFHVTSTTRRVRPPSGIVSPGLQSGKAKRWSPRFSPLTWTSWKYGAIDPHQPAPPQPRLRTQRQHAAEEPDQRPRVPAAEARDRHVIGLQPAGGDAEGGILAAAALDRAARALPDRVAYNS